MAPSCGKCNTFRVTTKCYPSFEYIMNRNYASMRRQRGRGRVSKFLPFGRAVNSRFGNGQLRRIWGGSCVPLEQLDVNDTGRLGRALQFTMTYLARVQAVLEKRVAAQNTSPRSLTAKEVKIITSHIVFVEKALRLARLLLRSLGAAESGQTDLYDVFSRANYLFRVIYENITPYFYLGVGKPSVGYNVVKMKRGKQKYVLPGTSSGMTTLEPTQKTVVPYFPPWRYDKSFNMREATNTANGGETYWDGRVFFSGQTNVRMVNQDTLENRTKGIDFFYEPTEICEDFPESIELSGTPL